MTTFEHEETRLLASEALLDFEDVSPAYRVGGAALGIVVVRGGYGFGVALGLFFDDIHGRILIKHAKLVYPVQYEWEASDFDWNPISAPQERARGHFRIGSIEGDLKEKVLGTGEDLTIEIVIEFEGEERTLTYHVERHDYWYPIFTG